jgi:hypothetical protein
LRSEGGSDDGLEPHCTVRVTEPVELPEVAVIVVVPVATSVVIPVLELMFATPTLEELHVGVTIVPELFVAKKVTEPVLNDAVNVLEP